MSAYDRKHQHVEPSHIAGADLPNWMRADPNSRTLRAAMILAATTVAAAITSPAWFPLLLVAVTRGGVS